MTLRDYSRRQIPIFAEVDMEISHQGRKTSATVYLRSDQATGESSLLGTNVLVDLGWMFPGLGVKTCEERVSDGGGVRLINAERIPSRGGMVVEARFDRPLKGEMMVEPFQKPLHKLDIESMLVKLGLLGRINLITTPMQKIYNGDESGISGC